MLENVDGRQVMVKYYEDHDSIRYLVDLVCICLSLMGLTEKIMYVIYRVVNGWYLIFSMGPSI